MRWEALFADLSGQAEAADDAQWRADAQGRERSERAGLTLADRMAAALEAVVTVTLATGDVVSGTVRDVADEWILMEDAQRRDHVVPAWAIAGIAGLREGAVVAGGVARRLTLGHALRAIARDRSRVVVVTSGMRAAGVMRAVGRDYVDVAEPGGSPVSVPFAAMVCVSSA